MTGSPIVVTAATGKTGRRVHDLLVQQGIAVRPVSRSSRCRFDWEEPSTWAATFEGASAGYLAYAPDLAVPGSAGAVAGVAAEAVRHGVTRLVLLSGRGEAGAVEAEQAVREILPATTVVRCSFFAQNFSEGAFHDGVREGRLVLPVDGVGEPFVHLDDVADIAVAALTATGHEGATYEVTGPQLLTFEDALAAISAGTGKPVAFQSLPLGAWVEALTADGVPPEVLSMLSHVFSETLDGRNSWLGDGVQRALGREPRSFGAYVEGASAANAWG